jgi:hypothetical protein
MMTLVSLFSSVITRGAVEGLINTGTDASGSRLPAGTVQPGWAITAVTPPNPPGGLIPPIPPSNAYVVEPSLAWTPNELSPASAWISYQSPVSSLGDEARQFRYELKFSAEPGDQFFMRLEADNGVRASLNNATSGLIYQWGPFDPPSDVPYQAWSPWVDVSGFSTRENTLIFDVNNLAHDLANPTGLRVEFSNVPEPLTLRLYGVGLLFCGALGLGYRRRRDCQHTRSDHTSSN